MLVLTVISMASYHRQELWMQRWQSRDIMEESLKQKNCISVVSLDVRGAFDAAWWPGILSNLKELKCPKNLFNLTVI
jgi:hypothetical protein